MVAQTILMQLGGWRFAAFTGSKQFTDMGNGLRMNLARNKTSANRLDIIYDGGTDLYTLRFYRKTFSKKTFEVKVNDIAKYEGIYFDQLQSLFTEVTGLRTHFWTSGGFFSSLLSLGEQGKADKESSKETQA